MCFAVHFLASFGFGEYDCECECGCVLEIFRHRNPFNTTYSLLDYIADA